MNGLLLLIVAIVIYGLGYRYYGAFLERLFGLDASRPTPAHTMRDDLDYVPSKPFILFGHHFSSIAGAGPIVGPIMAAYFGWGAVVLWLLVGCVFIGAMHDMAAMALSVRNKGLSIASVIEQYVGYAGRQLFLIFCAATLILVVAIFAGFVADGFVAAPGVASASILFIVMAPIFGVLVYKKGVSILKASLVFVPLVFLFIWLGTIIPLDLGKLFGLSATQTRGVWVAVLMIYAALASVLPVWTLLQPRDYLNSYLLYAMLVFGLLGIAVYRPELRLPAFEGVLAADFRGKGTSIFPFLFITIACGACSGFHSLVASGTSSKQIDNEMHIRPVAYGGMLVEGVLGIVSLIAVGYLAKDVIAVKMAAGISAPVLFAQGLAEFGTKLGIGREIGAAFVSLSVSAFLLTTLDTATRLARFTVQELFEPPRQDAHAVASAAQSPIRPPRVVARIFSNLYVATAICILLSAWLAIGEGSRIWPVFGASNQLLAALTLLVASLWLIQRKSKPLVALIPMATMLAVSGTGLYQLAAREFASGQNMTLGALCVLLLVLAVSLVIVSGISILKGYANSERI